MSEAPMAVCFPRDDSEFAEHVRLLVADSQDERPFAAAIQALLRETYPLAVISQRQGFAALDGGRVWYAYRDGSLVPNVVRETS